MKMHSVAQYAKRKNVSRQAILKAIKKKKVKAIKVGNFWVIKK